jgi:CRP-like cAMP-binding protein
VIVTVSLSRALAAPSEAWDAAGRFAIRTRQDQVLYYEDDPADAVYLLVEGHLVAYVASPDEETREQASLLLAAPALTGDREALLGIRCQETVACLSSCRVLSFDRQAFLAELDAELRLAVMSDLAARFASNLQMTWIQRQNIASKLRWVLAGLLALEPRMPSIDRLAALVRANPKTVRRGLRTLEEEGVLSILDDVASIAAPAPLALPLFHSMTR